MNRLVIIGNGFDLAHGLKTSYKDFIRWYLNVAISKFLSTENWTYSDLLLDLKLEYEIYEQHSGRFKGIKNINVDEYATRPLEFLNQLRSIDKSIVKEDILLSRILHNIENKGWTDIESDYYGLLKENADNLEVCKRLNDQMDFLRDKLAEYLKSQESNDCIDEITTVLKRDIKIYDIDHDSLEKIGRSIPAEAKDEPSKYINPKLTVGRTMLLDFNYTSTTEKYKSKSIEVTHIHGTLDEINHIVFGYGDEMDKDFQDIEDRNENELLKNTKSVKYLEDDKYKKLLDFIGWEQFQVYIMGHSCGNSDRTLLHTIFEHKNCVSIKPFYYKWGEGEDDDTYSEITRNIYRNFKDKALFRDRVSNKKQCIPLPQAPKKED